MVTIREVNDVMADCPPILKEQNDQLNIFDRAIFEHNLISLTRLYDNISFETISKFLSIEEDKVKCLNLDNILYF